MADWIFLLVRTEPDESKHAGISYILLSMDTPGIEVSPLRTMTGAAEFNQVFFTDVRVAKSHVVGARGEGWKIANTTLKHERNSLGSATQTESLLRSRWLSTWPLVQRWPQALQLRTTLTARRLSRPCRTRISARWTRREWIWR